MKDKIKPDQIDNVINGESLNLQRDPRLFDIIVKNMIHDPWLSVNPRSSCVKDGKYTKRYPRQPLHDTKTCEDRYQLYRRRRPEDSGMKVKVNQAMVGFKDDGTTIDEAERY